MLVALVLRISMVWSSGIWRDEAQFLWIVRFPSLGAMIEFLQLHESHPPLFYLMMRGWLAALGDTEAAALALPIALGVALVPAAYLVGERTLGHCTGLIAAVLVATSPRLALHAGLVRPYTLLPLLCLASVYTLWRGLTGRRARDWIAHVAATLLLLSTHNWAWLVLGAQWVVAGGWMAANRGGPGGRPLRGWILAQAAILAGYAPWLATLIHQSRHAGHGPGPVDPLDALRSFSTATTSLPLLPALVLGLVLARTATRGATCPAATGGVASKDQDLAFLLFLLVPVVAFSAAAVLSARSFLLDVRCLLTVAPCLLLAIAHGIARAPDRPRLVIMGILTGSYLVTSLTFFGHLKSNAREVAAAVAAQARPTDLILIEPCFFISSFNYYYNNTSRRIVFAPSGERAGAACFDDVEDRLQDPESMRRLRGEFARAREEGRRIWLVTDRDNLTVDDVPDSDGLPPMHRAKSACIRYNQIRKALNSLYGPPDTQAVPVDGREGWEIFRVFLYGTDDPGSGPGSGPTARAARAVAPGASGTGPAPRHSSMAAARGATLVNQR
jgi:hypothetical protein